MRKRPVPFYSMQTERPQCRSKRKPFCALFTERSFHTTTLCCSMGGQCNVFHKGRTHWFVSRIPSHRSILFRLRGCVVDPMRFCGKSAHDAVI